MSSNFRIALIHDEFIRRGGAERVCEEILRVFPESDIYALYAGSNPKLTVDRKTYAIHTSFLQNFPVWFRKHPGRMLPFLPHAAEQFDLSQYDIVISSSSGFAKGIVTRSHVPHVSYTHTPTRYLWDDALTVARNRKRLRLPLKILQHYLRIADYAAAQRPDFLIANSEYTRSRIKKFYHRDSTVIYPPIDTSFFTPKSGERLWSRQDPFLVVGRLTPTKLIHHAISVCEKLQLPLVVVGVGQEQARLKKLGGKHTTFIGKANQEELRSLYRQSRALLHPGIEDFGMVVVEALACGTPVIAQDAGGVREIMTSKKQGVLYEGEQEEHLAEAIRKFIESEKTFNAGEMQKSILRFSSQRFDESLKNYIEDVLKRWNTVNSR